MKNLEHIQKISLEKVINFPNHPYKVLDDEEMFNMAESVKENGVINPIIVRPKEDGNYEIVSGHRRKRASELAGLKEIPAIVREMSDEDAIILMVDCNKQREKVLPSEKAFAYKMKLEALKKQGRRNDLTSYPMGTKLENKGTAEIIGEEFEDSRNNVYRYIRLTELIPELLEKVDEEKMALRPAVEISYFNKDDQYLLLDAIDYLQVMPSHYQSIILRKKSEAGELTAENIEEILGEEKPNQKEQIKFNVDKVREYFPKNYSVEQMQSIITKLLENYRTQWQNKNKDYTR